MVHFSIVFCLGMEPPRLQQIFNWAGSEEARLCKQYAFQPIKEAQLDSLTYKSISAAANVIHDNLEKGRYLDSPIVKFVNYKLPKSYMNSQNSVTRQVCWELKSFRYNQNKKAS